MVRLQREFWALPIFAGVALGFAGWLANSVLWSLFYTALGITALVLLFRFRNWRRVSMTRTIFTREKHLEAGCRVRVTIAVKTTGLVPYPWIDLKDSLPPPLARTRTSLAGGRVVWLDRRQEREIVYYLENVPRGLHRLESIDVRSGDPFGMMTFSDRFRSFSQLVVYPKVVNLNAWRFFPRRVDGTASSKNTLNYDLSQLVGVRQYNYGDRLSLIHWKSSAKTGELHSKEYAPLLTDSSLVVLDCSVTAWNTGFDPAFEEAVRVATSLVRAAWLQRIPVRFYGNWGQESEDVTVANQNDYARFLLHMANITPLGRQTLSQAIYTGLHTQGVNVVVITPVVGAKLQRMLFRLSARGNTVTVINVDRDPANRKAVRPVHGSFSSITINKAEDLIIPSPRKEATP